MSDDTALNNEDTWQAGRDLAESLSKDEQPRTHAHDEYLAQTEDRTIEPRQTQRNVESTTTGDVAGAEGPYDPGQYTVDEVKQYVTDHPDERDAIWDAEESGKGRVGLVDWFNSQSTA